MGMIHIKIGLNYHNIPISNTQNFMIPIALYMVKNQLQTLSPSVNFPDFL